jgi:hypothetical protein
MGVEYSQFYVARDPTWRGRARTVVPRVDAVLRDWNLVVGAPAVFDLARGQCTKLPDTIESVAIPENVGIAYPEVFTEEPRVQQSIERIMGPSYYGEKTRGQRYFQHIHFVAGLDIRVHPSSEYFGVEVSGEEIVEPEYPWTSTFWGTIVRRIGAPWPRSNILNSGVTPVPSGFTGLWRCGLQLDCGKDLPAFIDQGLSPPGVEFRRALETAIDSEVIEICLVN